MQSCSGFRNAFIQYVRELYNAKRIRIRPSRRHYYGRQRPLGHTPRVTASCRSPRRRRRSATRSRTCPRSWHPHSHTVCIFIRQLGTPRAGSAKHLLDHPRISSSRMRQAATARRASRSHWPSRSNSRAAAPRNRTHRIRHRRWTHPETANCHRLLFANRHCRSRSLGSDRFKSKPAAHFRTRAHDPCSCA